MLNKTLIGLAAGLLALNVQAAQAQTEIFHAGAVIPDFGKIASVDTDFAIPAGAEFKVSFDVMTGAKTGKINRSLDAAARFLNMHHAAGVPVENIHLAVVIHGGALNDVTKAESYANKVGGENSNAKLIEQMLNKGVKIIVCGQSAVAQSVTREDLIPGVQMALSAMTAHALLQQEGYDLNPF